MKRTAKGLMMAAALTFGITTAGTVWPYVQVQPQRDYAPQAAPHSNSGLINANRQINQGGHSVFRMPQANTMLPNRSGKGAKVQVGQSEMKKFPYRNSLNKIQRDVRPLQVEKAKSEGLGRYSHLRQEWKKRKEAGALASTQKGASGDKLAGIRNMLEQRKAQQQRAEMDKLQKKIFREKNPLKKAQLLGQLKTKTTALAATQKADNHGKNDPKMRAYSSEQNVGQATVQDPLSHATGPYTLEDTGKTTPKGQKIYEQEWTLDNGQKMSIYVRETAPGQYDPFPAGGMSGITFANPDGTTYYSPTYDPLMNPTGQVLTKDTPDFPGGGGSFPIDPGFNPSGPGGGLGPIGGGFVPSGPGFNPWGPGGGPGPIGGGFVPIGPGYGGAVVASSPAYVEVESPAERETVVQVSQPPVVVAPRIEQTSGPICGHVQEMLDRIAEMITTLQEMKQDPVTGQANSKAVAELGDSILKMLEQVDKEAGDCGKDASAAVDELQKLLYQVLAMIPVQGKS